MRTEWTTCPECNGAGTVDNRYCSKCGGRGRLQHLTGGPATGEKPTRPFVDRIKYSVILAFVGPVLGLISAYVYIQTWDDDETAHPLIGGVMLLVLGAGVMIGLIGGVVIGLIVDAVRK